MFVSVSGIEIVDITSLTGVDSVGVAGQPLRQRETKEEREAKDEEISRRVHVNKLKV